jgi:uncharacterized protein involved in exopolysaccharide biosynthesis
MKTLTELARETKIQETLYTTLMSELQGARIEEEREAVQFEVLDRAVPPMKKSGPSLIKNLAVAAFLAFLVALMIAFLRSSMPRTRLGIEGTSR